MNWLNILSWLIAFSVAALVAPLVIRLYRRLGWVDDPNLQHFPKTTHLLPVPRGGGLVVAAGIAAAGVLFLGQTNRLWGVMLGALILLVSGTLDDHYDINPYVRYVLNIIAALCVVISGIGIDFVTNPFGQGVLRLDVWQWQWSWFGLPITISLLADTFAILWIVWNMNAVNWSKGVDGQLPSFVTIAAFFIALLSLRFRADQTQGVVTNLALAVSGAYAGLLLWNFYPQKMMPGYAAGSMAGYFLAVLSILGGAKIATALLLLALPTVDGIFTIVRRMAAGRSPFWGDRGHLHHRLLDAGWGRRRIAVFYSVSTAFFGIVALQLNSEGKLYVLLAAVILFAVLVLWLKHSISFLKPPDRANG
jgi:UDP-GlcNAc:undecaprenyl-phosphate/decaprenyl-phosphate GlcNAc-1-phosphate transferase